MTKWFDTNYHYLVPEFESRQTFRLASTAPIDAFGEALSLGIRTRPVLLGPVSFLLLGKSKAHRCRAAGAARRGCCRSTRKCFAGWPRRGPIGSRSTSRCWPSICRPRRSRPLESAYARLAAVSDKIKICLATYFGGLRRESCRPPCGCRWRPCTSTWSARRSNSTRALRRWSRPDAMLSLGVIDGRNIWRADLERALALVGTGGRAARAGPAPGRRLPARCCTARSTWSWKTHWTRSSRAGWPSRGRSWPRSPLLTRGVNEGREAVADALAASRESLARRGRSARIHRPEVQAAPGRR